MKHALFRSVSIGFLSAAALAGCAVGPNYARPSAVISPTFKEAAGWTPALPADTLDRGDWWTLFNDPILNALEAKVQVSNQNIIAAEAAYREARAAVSVQQAALFPVVDLTGSGTTSGGGAGTTGTVVGGAGGQVVTARTGAQSTTRYIASVGASWEPDIWGRIRRTIEGAKALAQVSEADLAAARLAAQGQLAIDYFGVRLSDAQIDVDKATVAAYQRTLKIAQDQYNAGTGPKSNVLLAQTQVYNAQSALTFVAQQRAVFEHAVAVLAGEAPGNFTLAPAPWIGTVPEVPPGVPSTLLQRRPDIAAAERQVKFANAQIGVQIAAYFPNITLSGSYGFSASQLANLFSSSTSLWSYGAAIAETVFDAGARRGLVKEARAAHDVTVAQYRQVVLTALQNVEDELAIARVLAQQIVLLRQAQAAADQAEQLVLYQYKAGTVDFAVVVIAQVAAYQARLAVIQAELQQETTAVALIQSLGGGWTAPWADSPSAPIPASAGGQGGNQEKH
ncbi:efflux transporter outer membrane subunit [Phenylobacterium sp.]|uniref:efflux transporter outer membrane subunit n=1 Tax=Phenylobacterium sp. TaxID=1871053 RepID=UPI002E2F10A7|nr:efflux transporter outer membrane subunit [Phenylobacterium sp.]HEX4709372.1 efflux transporter outer membrane subunit [Phenylobacterium sp.]